ncbi:NAD(P)H-dependent oxidoreductase [Allosphingosinicella flava]|uniref:NAD(P)H-dependent oxidoreductase n=1 Tax=Allosphingosinicella flava TaxID=2771430 RepID=A0A7T2LM33_9SPHN|nr:NAD(P)H-dependent oxidoreductase [Sphingosinicella flava]QPQ54968.1 NAD(P)H-dependent oxidoreductase [Sphingosinicella flava]
MAHILLIDAHPDKKEGHLVHALADAYEEGASEDNDVRRINVSDLRFPILHSPEDWLHRKPPVAIREAQQDILWADHLAFFYPLWLGDMPALLKGFLEQVARPGFAIDMSKGFPRKLLTGRSARIVVTMGMPALFYRLVYRAHSLKSLKRNILNFAGITPVRATVVGGVDSETARHRALAEMAVLGRRGR